MTPAIAAYLAGVLAAAVHLCRDDLEAWPLGDRLIAIVFWPFYCGAAVLVGWATGPDPRLAGRDSPCGDGGRRRG